MSVPPRRHGRGFPRDTGGSHQGAALNGENQAGCTQEGVHRDIASLAELMAISLSMLISLSILLDGNDSGAARHSETVEEPDGQRSSLTTDEEDPGKCRVV